jgi:hypothetical protein
MNLRPEFLQDRNLEPEDATPRYEVGQTAGDFTIAEYLGYSDIHPETATKLHAAMHWYRVICSCSRHVIRTQQQLRDNRRERKCDVCKGNPTPGKARRRPRTLRRPSFPKRPPRPVRVDVLD